MAYPFAPTRRGPPSRRRSAMSARTAVGARRVPTRSAGPYVGCPSAEHEEGAGGTGQVLELLRDTASRSDPSRIISVVPTWQMSVGVRTYPPRGRTSLFRTGPLYARGCQWTYEAPRRRDRHVDVMSTTQAPTPIIKASPALSTQTHALKGPSRRQAHDVETTAASQEVDHIEDPLAARDPGELHILRRSGDARPKQSPVVTSLHVADRHRFVPRRGRPADHPPQPWSTTRCAGFPGRPISYPHPSGRGGRSSPSCRSDRSRR